MLSDLGSAARLPRSDASGTGTERGRRASPHRTPRSDGEPSSEGPLGADGNAVPIMICATLVNAGSHRSVDPAFPDQSRTLVGAARRAFGAFSSGWERVARRREIEAMREPTPPGRPAASTARAIRAQARCGSARAVTQASCGRPARCGARSKSRRLSASSPAATHITALPASTAMPADTTTCSPTPARRATSVRAATRSGCCSTASGSSRTCSRPCRTGSTTSPSRGSCARASAGTGHGSASSAASPPACW